MDNYTEVNELTQEGPDHFWAKLEMSRNLMAPYRLRFDRCQAYVRGDQLLSYQTGKDDLTPLDARRRKGKVVVNQLLNIYRQVCARLATNYPSIAVLPATDLVDDIMRAQSSEQLLRYYWQSAGMREVLRKTVQWLVSTGTCGLRTRYNTQKKAVETECIRPYDLRFEPYANDPSESAWIGVCSYVRKEELLKQYPEHADEILAHASPAIRYYTYGPQSLPEDRYEMYDVYHRDGFHEVWAGGCCCYRAPTPNGRFPVQIIRYTEVEGYVWGLGLIEPLLDPQDLYNDVRTQIRANIKLVGNPKILTPDEAEIDARSFTDQPGEKIRFKGGIPPTHLSPPPLPQYMVEEPAKLLSEIYDISGIHGTTLGKRTQGLSAGVAIDAVEQNDTQQLQLTQDGIEDAVKEVAIDVLCYMRAYYNESKMVRMLDSAGKIVWGELNQERIQDDPEIFLEAGSLFRSEAADRDKRTMQLVQMQMLEPKEARRMLSFRLEPLHLITQLQGMRHAQEVLEAVAVLGPAKDPATGQPIPRAHVYPTDDLESLDMVFSQYMRTPDFYALDPAAQQAVADVYTQVVQLMNPQTMAPPQGPQPPRGGPQMPGQPQGSPLAMQGANTPLDAAALKAGGAVDQQEVAAAKAGQPKQ